MYRKNSRKRLSKKRSAFKKRTINRKKKTYRKRSNKVGGGFSTQIKKTLAKRRTDFQFNWKKYYLELLNSENNNPNCPQKYLSNFKYFMFEFDDNFLFIKCYRVKPEKPNKQNPDSLLAVQFLLSEENKVRIFTTNNIGELLVAIDVNNNFILENLEQRVNLKRSYLSIDNIPYKICFNRVGRDELYDPWTDIKLLRKKFKKNGFVIIGNY